MVTKAGLTVFGFLADEDRLTLFNFLAGGGLMWPSKGTVKYGHIRQAVA